jgi:acyl-CoA synthetase (NDP forming)
MIDLMVAFVHAGPANGPNVAILGGAGGEMVETADLCHEAGLHVLPLPEDVRESLKEKLPNTWDWVGNPIDASILEWGRNEALEVIRAMAASPDYHAVLANIRWLEHTLNREDGEDVFRRTLQHLKSLAKDYGKATVMVWRTGKPSRRPLAPSAQPAAS